MDRLLGHFGTAWNFAVDFIHTISVSDVLDMVIIIFLIFQLMMLFKRTNSSGVLKGVLLLFAALVFSDIFRLEVVNYLLGRAFEMGLLMVVVIFQPEIRQILEKVGTNSFNMFLSRQSSTRTLENAITQIVLACGDMAESRTGALIVIERSNNLDAYIKTGTIVDAAPAVELLKNIFYNKAPLHDGAVIIRNARIAGAACMLPLSGNTNISRSLGMRHRAGIGMSERSDAVVIIVSEETGAISVALEGILKHGLTTETLEKLIRQELLPETDEKKSGFLGFLKGV
ncbi:MAG: diadenylate cyclase CdaA [bacterium]